MPWVDLPWSGPWLKEITFFQPYGLDQGKLTYRYTQRDFIYDKWHHCSGLENYFTVIN